MCCKVSRARYVVETLKSASKVQIIKNTKEDEGRVAYICSNVSRLQKYPHLKPLQPSLLYHVPFKSTSRALIKCGRIKITSLVSVNKAQTQINKRTNRAIRSYLMSNIFLYGLKKEGVASGYMNSFMIRLIKENKSWIHCMTNKSFTCRALKYQLVFLF